MGEAIDMKKMYRELLALRKEVSFIKNHVINMEVVMTSEEENQLKGTLEEHRKGKTKRIEDLKIELGD